MKDRKKWNFRIEKSGMSPSRKADRKLLETHREEITLHKAAKQAFDDLGVKKIPKVKDLNEEYARLLSGKKTAYAEYRKLRDEAQELVIAQSNIGSIFEYGNEKVREQEKEMQKR